MQPPESMLTCGFADHGYSAGGKDALLANCGFSCASCDKWRGDGNCWSGTFTYDSCCNPLDGVGNTECWTDTHNYATCQCGDAPLAPGAR